MLGIFSFSWPRTSPCRKRYLSPVQMKGIAAYLKLHFSLSVHFQTTRVQPSPTKLLFSPETKGIGQTREVHSPSWGREARGNWFDRGVARSYERPNWQISSPSFFTMALSTDLNKQHFTILVSKGKCLDTCSFCSTLMQRSSPQIF